MKGDDEWNARLFVVSFHSSGSFAIGPILLNDPSSGSEPRPLESPHFGHCPPNPVDDESDFRHRTRLGLMAWS